MTYMNRNGKVSNRVGGLNLHSEAKDTKDNIITALAPGDKVWVYYTDASGFWARVQSYKTKDKGWVALKHLDLDPAPAPKMEPIEEAPFWPWVAVGLAIIAIGAWSIGLALF